MTAPSQESQQVIDLAFYIQGGPLPLDHGYPLYSALCRILPSLHDLPDVGIHPVRGRADPAGLLHLDKTSRLRIRAPVEILPALLPLMNREVIVAGQALSIGRSENWQLTPSATLKSRLVTIKGYHDDAEQLLKAAQQQLAAQVFNDEELGQLEVFVGKRRVMQIAQHTIVGYALMVTGLSPDASLALQRSGLGGRRKMGAGLFVPPGRRA